MKDALTLKPTNKNEARVITTAVIISVKCCLLGWATRGPTIVSSSRHGPEKPTVKGTNWPVRCRPRNNQGKREPLKGIGSLSQKLVQISDIEHSLSCNTDGLFQLARTPDEAETKSSTGLRVRGARLLPGVHSRTCSFHCTAGPERICNQDSRLPPVDSRMSCCLDVTGKKQFARCKKPQACVGSRSGSKMHLSCNLAHAVGDRSARRIQYRRQFKPL